MGYPLKQASTAQPLVFLMVLSSDHLTGATGLSPTVKLSKAGAAGAAPAGAVSEIDATNMPGWYKVAGNAADSGTLGPLALHASAAGADPVDELYHVVAYDPQTTSLGLSLAKTTNITGFNDIAATAIVSGGAITTASGKAAATLAATDVTGNLPADVQTIKTQTITCSAAVTVGPFVGQGNAAVQVDGSGFVKVSAGTAAGQVNLSGGNVTVGTNNDKAGYALTVAPPTAAAIATAVWTDTTSGDFTTAGSPGLVVVTRLGNTLQSAGGANYQFTTTALALAPTGGSAPTASQIATAVWTDTTAGDFATVGSPGKAVIDNLNATVGSRSTYAGGPVASVTAPVTVGTNNDKAGYALTTAEHTAIVADATAALGAAIPGSPTAGSIFDRIDAKVSSRMATFSYTAPDNAGILAAVATRQATLGAVEHGEAFEKAFSLMFSTVISGKTNGPAAGFAGTFIVTEGANQRVSAPVTADGYRTTAPTLTAP
jgi:hypothetical protein